MSRWVYIPILALVMLVCKSCNIVNMPESVNFSFEHGMEGWTTSGTDLDNPPDQWSIELSRDMASKGETLLRFYLDNVNDAGNRGAERMVRIN